MSRFLALLSGFAIGVLFVNLVWMTSKPAPPAPPAPLGKPAMRGCPPPIPSTENWYYFT